MSSRSVWIAVGLAVVALVAAAYWFTQSARQGPVPRTEVGLSWLPAESVLVASVHVGELRQQTWLTELVEQAAPVEEEADYREFVQATGFSYARDLDRLWLGVVPGASRGEVVGIAQGRVDQQRIVTYARQQGAQRVSLAGVEAYGLERTEPRRRFAFAFLDQDRIAFAETLSGVGRILACVRKASPSVASDAGRRAGLERFAAGMHVWAVDEDVSRWPPPELSPEPDIGAQLRRLAAAARATPEGIELVAEGETREPALAGRLKLLLETYALAGRVLLSRRDDPTSSALREILAQAALTQEENSLTLRVTLSRMNVASLLTTDSTSLPAEHNR